MATRNLILVACLLAVAAPAFGAHLNSIKPVIDTTAPVDKVVAAPVPVIDGADVDASGTLWLVSEWNEVGRLTPGGASLEWLHRLPMDLTIQGAWAGDVAANNNLWIVGRYRDDFLGFAGTVDLSTGAFTAVLETNQIVFVAPDGWDMDATHIYWIHQDRLYRQVKDLTLGVEEMYDLDLIDASAQWRSLAVNSTHVTATVDRSTSVSGDVTRFWTVEVGQPTGTVLDFWMDGATAPGLQNVHGMMRWRRGRLFWMNNNVGVHMYDPVDNHSTSVIYPMDIIYTHQLFAMRMTENVNDDSEIFVTQRDRSEENGHAIVSTFEDGPSTVRFEGGYNGFAVVNNMPLDIETNRVFLVVGLGQILEADLDDAEPAWAPFFDIYAAVGYSELRSMAIDPNSRVLYVFREDAPLVLAVDLDSAVHSVVLEGSVDDRVKGATLDVTGGEYYLSYGAGDVIRFNLTDPSQNKTVLTGQSTFANYMNFDPYERVLWSLGSDGTAVRLNVSDDSQTAFPAVPGGNFGRDVHWNWETDLLVASTGWNPAYYTVQNGSNVGDFSCSATSSPEICSSLGRNSVGLVTVHPDLNAMLVTTYTQDVIKLDFLEGGFVNPRQACAPGFWGANCFPCPYCGDGIVCDDGLTGTGSCDPNDVPADAGDADNGDADNDDNDSNDDDDEQSGALIGSLTPIQLGAILVGGAICLTGVVSVRRAASNGSESSEMKEMTAKDRSSAKKSVRSSKHSVKDASGQPMDHVAATLKRLNMSKYQKKLAKANINDQTLPLMTQESLISAGMKPGDAGLLIMKLMESTPDEAAGFYASGSGSGGATLESGDMRSMTSVPSTFSHAETASYAPSFNGSTMSSVATIKAPQSYTTAPISTFTGDMGSEHMSVRSVAAPHFDMMSMASASTAASTATIVPPGHPGARKPRSRSKGRR